MLIGTRCRLKVKGDNRWYVMSISETDPGTVDSRLKFCDGWTTFCRAYDIAKDQLLIFEIDLVRSAHYRPVFVVKLYGTSGCLQPVIVTGE